MIKFRAWVKEQRKMIFVGAMEWDIDHNIQSIEQFNTYDTFFLQDVELMQWTGIIDIDGNEIYQGDIISTDWDGSYVYGIVLWSDKYAAWWVNYLGDADGDYLSDAKGKVIGDIYENPELLRNDNASIQTMQIL